MLLLGTEWWSRMRLLKQHEQRQGFVAILRVRSMGEEEKESRLPAERHRGTIDGERN